MDVQICKFAGVQMKKYFFKLHLKAYHLYFYFQNIAHQ